LAANPGASRKQPLIVVEHSQQIIFTDN